MKKRSVILLIIFTLILTYTIVQIPKKITGNITLEQNEFITQVDYSYDLSDKDLRDNALIIYNENYIYGREIAEYYALKRNIPFNQICGVKLPLGQFADYTYFKGARKTVIEDCICNNIDLSKLTGSCTQDNIDNIAAISPFTHLVFTKGIPLQIYNTPGWTDGRWTENHGIPFETFFSAYLYNKNFESTAPTIVSDFFEGDRFIALHKYFDSVDPQTDKIAVHGRIEAMTKERTFDLIDRIIASEEQGLKGNIFIEDKPRSTIELPTTDQFLFSTVLDNNAICQQYYDTSTTTSWLEGCRVGVGHDGHGAGRADSGIKPAVNMTLYLGYNPFGNGQKSFGSIWNMLGIQKTSQTCTLMCKDFPTPQEQELCAQNSKDFFKQINTDCVGGTNLLGIQVISYSTQYFGFFPAGWNTATGGGYEKTPPTIRETGGFQNSRFTDTKYIKFGEENKTTITKCINENGQEETCEEHIFINIQSNGAETEFLQAPIGPSQSRDFKVIFRYKNPQNNPNARIRVQLIPVLSNGTIIPKISQLVNVNQEGTNWNEKEVTLTITNNYDQNNVNYNQDIVRVYLEFYSDINGYYLTNSFSLDGIEFIDVSNNQELISPNTGSFNNEPLFDTQPGGWASDAIERIGAIGWWGSMGHFLTSGWAFSYEERFVGAFFSGKSLGESIYNSAGYYKNGRDIASGLIFADPLYRPSGVKIYEDTGTVSLGKKGETIFDSSLTKKVKINAFHGSKNKNTVTWEVSVCPGIDERNCENNNQWQRIINGKGERYEYEIGDLPMFKELASQLNNRYLTVKLKVYNEGEEEYALTNIAYMYFPSLLTSNIICNIDTDCGTTTYENNFCYQDELYNDKITYTCQNAGTTNSYCLRTYDQEIKEDCPLHCINNQCEEGCTQDAHCPQDSYSENFCSSGGVYRYFNNNSCIQNECVTQTTSQQVAACEFDCQNAACIPYCTVDAHCASQNYETNICQDNNVYTQLHNFICSGQKCTEQVTQTLSQTCEYGCTDGRCNVQCLVNNDCPADYDSTPYCFNGDVYKDNNDYWCTRSTCAINVEKILVEDCSNACDRGVCVNIQPDRTLTSIRFNKFKDQPQTTNLTNRTIQELENITNLTFAINNKGKIQFINRINLTQNIKNNTLDFDQNINISENYIFINSTELTSLKTNAIVTLYNITFTNPEILRDGSVCADCTIISYADNTLQFNVSSFSVYTTREKQTTDSGNDGGGTQGGGSNNGGGGGGGNGGGENTGDETISAQDSNLSTSQEPLIDRVFESFSPNNQNKITNETASNEQTSKENDWTIVITIFTINTIIIVILLIVLKKEKNSKK